MDWRRLYEVRSTSYHYDVGPFQGLDADQNNMGNRMWKDEMDEKRPPPSRSEADASISS